MIVCNTSPIINLAAIGELEILKKLYGKIVIPGAVYDEITVKGRGQPGDEEVRTSGWIEVINIKDRNLLTALAVDLHPGEAEAIILAMEQNSDLLIIDENRARRISSKFGIRFMGLLGVLLRAKRKGYIPAVKPLMDDLAIRAGFWIDRELYQTILKTAGER
ncbi:MAG: DUF3368 domain-containing protein [Candidatus Aminicenantes bacterium]|nr:DUF3368 domain-containing protein [Candidatus Aminicenantes bacterium]